MQHTVLLVDDEKDILDSLERQLRKHYRILKASSGIEALRTLNQEPVHLILSDQRMPEMTGVQLFERAQKIQPDAIRILLTGYTDVESVIAAINNGQIYRYVTKPWDPTDLEIIVNRALETFDLRHELREKNKKLQLALDELKTLDQAKSHFMILIGHELKTPLTTISSFTDLLMEEALGDDSKKYLERISQGRKRLEEIIFDVLDILSAETAQLKLQKASHKLGDVVSTVVQDLKLPAEKKAVTINTNIKARHAYFDPAIIKKALRKIVHNAIKFSDGKSPVEISANENAGIVEIRVTNTGPVIPKSKISQILKPFTLDEDVMHHSQGLGLGLSVCQSLLKNHGSNLIIESASSGTTVGFDIRTDTLST